MYIVNVLNEFKIDGVLYRKGTQVDVNKHIFEQMMKADIKVVSMPSEKMKAKAVKGPVQTLSIGHKVNL